MAKSASSRAVSSSGENRLERHEQQELEATLWRFGQLTARAQLQAYEFIRGYLAEKVKETEADRQVTEQKAALEVIRRVAIELGLPAGKAPTTTQFDEVSKRLSLDWSVSRVGRAWGGKWRFACQAFIGARVHPSARQKALLEVGTGKRRAYENYRTCIQLWLATDPPIESITAYDAWRKEFNDSLPDGQAPLLQWTNIFANLRISFSDVLCIARGEAKLSDIPRRRVGDHEHEHGPLVARNWILAEYQLSPDRLRYLSDRPGFPAPVVNLSGTRTWLEEDIRAYFAGEPFAEREEYELQHEYLSLSELAALMGKPPKRLVSQTMLKPKPAGLVSRKRYWRRDEAERWMQEKHRP